MTWTGRQCMGIGHRFSACGSLGGGAGGQSGPTARSQHQPMRAAQHTQPPAPQGCPDTESSAAGSLSASATAVRFPASPPSALVHESKFFQGHPS